MPPIEIPEDLTTLSNDELGSLVSTIRDAVSELADQDATEAGNETLRTYTATLSSIRELQTEREQTQASLSAERDSLTSQLEESEEEPAVTDDTPADDTPADDTPVEEEPPPAPAPAPTPRTISVPAAADRQPSEPETPADEPEAVQILAAAGLPDMSAGQQITELEAAEAFHRRVAGFPRTAGAARQTAPFASLQIPWSDDLSLYDIDTDGDHVLDHAADERRLPGGTLLAAGGWCSPSETMYDLCELESRSGRLDLPEIRIRRGGIRHTLGPDFRSIYDGSGFSYTEAEDIAGDYDGLGGGSKPCYDVPCPPFVEDRLNYDGTCVSSGILQDRAYPELTRRVIRGAVTAHLHSLAWNKLQVMLAGSESVNVPGFPLDSSLSPVLSAIELQVVDFKYRHRADPERTLEAVFPWWMKGVIRADLARRLGVDMLMVSDQRIMELFASRGARAQFIYNWQDDFTDGATGFGAAAAVTEWPTSVDFLLYSAGTWVGGTQALIELTAVYDSTLFRQNNFIGLFTEEAWLVAKRCHDSRLVTVPICPSGHTGAGQDYSCVAP